MWGNLLEDYLSTMPMPIPVPAVIEQAWRDAPSGREAAAVNELLRAAARAADSALAAALAAQGGQRKSPALRPGSICRRRFSA
jgi:hypothetical protein